MPKTEDIISGLHSIANQYSAFAIFWHVAFYLLIAFLAAKWQPSNMLFAMLICLPLLSVAVFAWMYGNPFNGTLFLFLSVLIFIFGFRIQPSSVSFSPFPFYLFGIIMIIFGIIYPHFLETGSFIKYLYASPVGLIPCPTLSIIIGFVLLYNGLGSQFITITLVVFGLFYAIFGVVKLAVYLDFFLLLGSLALLAKYIYMVKNPVS
jgi:hypothetical protein